MINWRATVFALNNIIQKYFEEDFRFIFSELNYPISSISRKKSEAYLGSCQTSLMKPFWEHR